MPRHLELPWRNAGPRVLALVCAVAAAACGAKFDADPTGSGGATTSAGGTGDGGGASTGGGSTGGGNTGGGSEGGGGNMSMTFTPCAVSDDFDDDALASIWAPYGNVTEVNQHVRVDLTQNGEGYHALFPMLPLRVRDCAMWIEVRAVGTTGLDGDTYFQVLIDNDTTVSISVFDGQILFTEEQNGVWVFEVSAAYDPAAHRWWMIREEAGTVHYATSPDGRAWTEQATRATPSFFDDTSFQAGGCTWNPVATPGHIELDNLNIRPP